MNCLRCGAAVPPEDVLCPSCGALQAPPSDPNPFALLGMPECFPVDQAILSARYLELQGKFHPDRFAQADARERLMSLEWSTRLNGAYAILRDPLRLAIWLLERQGLDPLGERGSTRDPELLMRQMAYRERVDELREGGDRLGLEALRGELLEERKRLQGDLTAVFDRIPPTDTERAMATVRELRFSQRLLEAVEEALYDEE